MREGLALLREKVVGCWRALSAFARQWRAEPTLGYTHLQPAQLTTVGKRATLWMQDLVLDLADIDTRMAALPLRGVKGTTGTQASFLELFHGDHAKVRALEAHVCSAMGFDRALPVTGQTYSRKIDAQVLGVVAGIAASAAKFSSDIRMLQSFGEMSEPFEPEQIGSSAMAYKRNPMRSERIASLARFVGSLEPNANQTHAVQYFERTLDDSANRRLVIPEAFLATDAILLLMENVARGLEVHRARIRHRFMDELPFMATEQLIVRAVEAGADRQVDSRDHPPPQRRGGVGDEEQRDAQRPARAARRRSRISRAAWTSRRPLIRRDTSDGRRNRSTSSSPKWSSPSSRAPAACAAPRRRSAYDVRRLHRTAAHVLAPRQGPRRV